MTKDEALKMAIEAIDYKGVRDSEPYWEMMNKTIKACKDALEQEERTQRTMYCGTADAFIAMDDDHKRRWFVQSLRESKRRKELEDILEQPSQEPVAWVKNNLICPENGYETTRTEAHPKDLGWTPLYTHPAPSWQELSDDEILSLNAHGYSAVMLDYEFARAIEQALKEKNNGD